MKPKSFILRLPEDVHKSLKMHALKNNISMSQWIVDLIELNLKRIPIPRKFLCQECGAWELVGTSMALLKDCEKCGKKEVATFPCEEK